MPAGVGHSGPVNEPSATAPAAADTMRVLLAEQPARRRHSAAVAARAENLAQHLTVEDRRALVASAWLHDVGHARRLRSSGLHALDGARHLAGRFPARVVALVAHHSGAQFEAELRGLGLELATFEQERSVVADLLTYCDLTTGPDGEPVDLRSRLAEVEGRYGADHVVVKSLRLAQPELERAVTRIERDVIATRAQRSAAGPPAR